MTSFSVSPFIMLERILGPALAERVRLSHVYVRADPVGPVLVFEIEGDNLPEGECSLVMRTVDTVDGRATLPPIFVQRKETAT